MRDRFVLSPEVTYLTHGSYGACPRTVLDEQARLRERMERDPIRFLAREIEALVDEARRALAAFLGAAPDELAFVTNATNGVNAVVRSLAFGPGDEILTTDHAYNACRNALDWVAGRTGARVVVAEVPFPLAGPDEIVAAVLAGASARTRLALIDHVTSPTALVFPLARLVGELQGRGIDVLVDGAHAPGMLPLDLAALGAAYYVGNCHKWMCAPKGAGFLCARRDRQEGLAPPVISHGWNAPRGRSRFHLLFDWTGSDDPTPWLCVPAAIAAVGAMGPGGWPAVMEANHALAVQARRRLCEALDIPPPCPDEMLGSMAALPLPDGDAEALAARLYERGIEVPVFYWPRWPRRLLRISAQVYNTPADYEKLAEALG